MAAANAPRIRAPRSSPRKRRIGSVLGIGVTSQLDGDVSEAVLARECERLPAELGLAEARGHVWRRDEHSEPRSRFDSARNTQLRQPALQRGWTARHLAANAHAALTPCKTLRDPERNPRRSSVTRANPAPRTARAIDRIPSAVSHSANRPGASSTRARSA